MEKNIGRVWVSLAVIALVIIIWIQGDSLKAIETKSNSAPFLTALSQLGILYIIALFVERALEVLIKAWRQGGKIALEQEKTSAENNNQDNAQKAEIQKNLEEYKAGTQRRALLVGLTLGILVSLSGVRLLGPIFQGAETEKLMFQMAVFNFTDIVLTAGLIAGGSSTIHELMALIDDFLKTSRKQAKEG